MNKFKKLAALTLALSLLISCTLPASAATYTAHMSLRRKSAVTVDELQAGLLYNLKPHADDYILAYERTGIDPVFLAAKDALESGWGRYPMDRYNVSGFFTKRQYNSICECIADVSNFIDREYLTPGGRFYKGDSVAAVNHYWSGHKAWETGMVNMMNDINRRIEAYRAQNAAPAVARAAAVKTEAPVPKAEAVAPLAADRLSELSAKAKTGETRLAVKTLDADQAKVVGKRVEKGPVVGVKTVKTQRAQTEKANTPNAEAQKTDKSVTNSTVRVLESTAPGETKIAKKPKDRQEERVEPTVKKKKPGKPQEERVSKPVEKKKPGKPQEPGTERRLESYLD